MEISGRAFAFWYYMEPGGLWCTNVLNLALPLHRHWPDTWPEHQDPVSHTAQKKREKKRKNKKIKKLVKLKIIIKKNLKKKKTKKKERREQPNQKTNPPMLSQAVKTIRKKKKIRTARTLGQMVKAKLYRQNHTKRHTYTHSQKEKKEEIIHIFAPKIHHLNFGMIHCLFRYSTDTGYIKLIVEI